MVTVGLGRIYAGTPGPWSCRRRSATRPNTLRSLKFFPILEVRAARLRLTHALLRTVEPLAGWPPQPGSFQKSRSIRC
jgi:hypothetical protein